MEHIVRPVQSLAISRGFYTSSRRVWNTSRETGPGKLGLQNSDRIQRRYKWYIAPEGGQAHPIEGFYSELLTKPKKKTISATRPNPIPPLPGSLPKSQKEQTAEKAKIVFGTRLAGPGERKAEIQAASKTIAGIQVPPRPTEPDNCCMSGCVNCVWDMYRDEVEEWAAKSAEARAAMQAQRDGAQGTGTMVAEKGTPSHVATSMDDDGGGSETNWVVDVAQDKLFDDIPVGIREFMKTEKRLKQLHNEEKAASG